MLTTDPHHLNISNHCNPMNNTPHRYVWRTMVCNHVSSLLQIKGTEESQLVLCRDVRFEQQCSAQALQDLGGEEHLNATVNDDAIIIHQMTKSVIVYSREYPARSNEFTALMRG